ncbi:MAG: hypothetical protein NTW28_35685, partial [Candidatus Solibacter sp.]|nr:hypothetical protein [Candidatus Solibacter sp.]
PAANRLPWLAGKATCAHQLNAGQASNEITELRPSFLRQKVTKGHAGGFDLPADWDSQGQAAHPGS